MFHNAKFTRRRGNYQPEIIFAIKKLTLNQNAIKNLTLNHNLNQTVVQQVEKLGASILVLETSEANALLLKPI